MVEREREREIERERERERERVPACEKDQTRQDSTWLPCGIPSVIHAFFLNRRMDSKWGSCVYGIACG